MSSDRLSGTVRLGVLHDGIEAAAASVVAKRNPVTAVAYLRTSSAANVGADKDSEMSWRRPLAALQRSSIT
jgi:hypothetical protein